MKQEIISLAGPYTDITYTVHNDLTLEATCQLNFTGTVKAKVQ